MKNNDQKSGNSTSSAKKGKNKCNNNNNNSNSNTNNNTSNNNNNSDKPKQPQRGLGVAQLEKIRLHSQMASCGILPHHQVPHHFLNPTYQHVPEDMRIQVGYQLAPPPPPPPPPFCYSSPSIPSSSYGYHHHPNNYMMAMGNHMERTSNIRYHEHQSINTARWNPNNNFRGMPETQPYTQQSGMVTRHLLSHVEQQNNRRNNLFESRSSSCQNLDSSENEELDLELKL
ncbi:hypothetical protein BVRB_8g196920 [Beta vulgaris subsp. vulgaris]|nr:hypothetical protein BVRB_8g196920 [Beta vulgaris subsp. vulgaris]